MPPATDPFPVMRDDNVAVTATLVAPLRRLPAFAFRFDLLRKSGRSVTFSGDTTKSDNPLSRWLAAPTSPAARGAVQPGRHREQQVSAGIPGAIYDRPNRSVVAAAAGARHVVLSLLPTDLPDSAWLEAIGSTTPDG